MSEESYTEIWVGVVCASFVIAGVLGIIFGMNIESGWWERTEYPRLAKQDSIRIVKRIEWENASDSTKLEIAKRERSGK